MPGRSNIIQQTVETKVLDLLMSKESKDRGRLIDWVVLVKFEEDVLSFNLAEDNLMGKRIAFIEIDDVLVKPEYNEADNAVVDSVEYNDALIRSIATDKYDEVYLVANGGPAHVWNRILNHGNPHADWKKQLLSEMVQHFQDQGVTVTAVSLPFDYYLNRTQLHNSRLSMEAWDGVRDGYHMKIPGQSYERFYASFEKTVVRVQSRPLRKLARENSSSDIEDEDPFAGDSTPRHSRTSSVDSTQSDNPPLN